MVDAVDSAADSAIGSGCVPSGSTGVRECSVTNPWWKRPGPPGITR